VLFRWRRNWRGFLNEFVPSNFKPSSNGRSCQLAAAAILNSMEREWLEDKVICKAGGQV
jgi:hypothetical protein